MRKRQAFIALALLSYILAGCYDAKDIKSGNHVPVINLDSAYVSDFNYSELFQSVRFIILDNTETLLANIDKMLLHKDTFLILDRKGQGVYAYRKDGTFIRKYGNHGSAPGEYVNCTDFTFSSQDAELYIYDRYRRKILTYDLHSGRLRETYLFRETVLLISFAIAISLCSLTNPKPWEKRNRITCCIK